MLSKYPASSESRVLALAGATVGSRLSPWPHPGPPKRASRRLDRTRKPEPREILTQVPPASQSFAKKVVVLANMGGESEATPMILYKHERLGGPCIRHKLEIPRKP